MKLMKDTERELRKIRTDDDWDKFKRRYNNPDRLNKNHPKCAIFPTARLTIMEIIPTSGTIIGVASVMAYDLEENLEYDLYSVYSKAGYDFRIYDSQEQLISLIESEEVVWEFLSSAAKEAIWYSFTGDSKEQEFRKKLEDVLKAKGLAQ